MDPVAQIPAVVVPAARAAEASGAAQPDTADCSVAAATEQWPFTTADDVFLLVPGRDHTRWNIIYEIRAAGSIDVARLQTAIRAVCARHPLLRARLRKDGNGYAWSCPPTLEADPLQVLVHPPDQPLDELRTRLIHARLPVEAGPPLRFTLVPRPGGDVLILMLHHAAGDGASALQVMREVAAVYRGQQLPAVDVDLAAVRDLDALVDGKDPVPAPSRHPRHSRWAGMLFSSKIARDGARPRDHRTTILHRTVPMEAVRSLRAGLPQPCTVNDVLLAMTHCTIDDWNRTHGRRAGKISVVIAIDSRPPHWDGVIGNYSATAEVVTWPQDRTDLATAVSAVVRRTKVIKEHSALATMHQPLAWARQHGLGRAALWLVRRAEPIGATALLSNLGQIDPPSFDDDGRPPQDVAIGTVWGRRGVGLLVFGAGDQLHVTVRYRAGQFDRAGAEAFLDAFLAPLPPR